jgi:FixJ family two-component response regulator
VTAGIDEAPGYRHVLVIETADDIDTEDFAEQVFDALKQAGRQVTDVHQHGGRKVRGERNGSARLTERQVLAIRDDNRSSRQVAADYGVSHTTVRKIRCGKLWGWVA